jgi:2-polyprenyl-3-methyl-5-hydroxy-6-metoxy-1,4-benzoquinol methylase
MLQSNSAIDAQTKVIWEECACLLCGSTESVPAIEAPDPTPAQNGMWFAVVQCESCGLRFTNPRPNKETIGQFYPADYQPHRRPRQLRKPLRRWYPLGTLRGRASERRSLPWHGKGRLLDFGCGGGSFIVRMADQGWKVIGLDASVGAVREIQEKLGLKALVGSLPHPDLKPETFDVITMWHSLEHVHEPKQILQEAWKLLVPGGRLLIATPNIESWPFYWFGQSWFGLDLPRHLIHFCPKTIRSMLETTGFRVASIRGLRHSDWLRSSARLASRNQDAKWWQRAMKYKPFARLSAWFCFIMGRADCMIAVAERP